MDKRPDCELCGEKESAMMVVHGQMLCGHCVVKYDNYKKSEDMKKFEEFKKCESYAQTVNE